MRDGALPPHVKELVALMASVVKRCDGCIATTEGCRRAGANAEEVAEAIGVALLMDGGAASVYAPRAWDAHLEFAGAAEHKPPR